jgi:hypothetical protein
MNPTRYINILDMLKAVSDHAKLYPEHTIIGNDTPAYIGFLAFDSNSPLEPPDDISGWWQISLTNTKRSFNTMPKCIAEMFRLTSGRKHIIAKLKEMHFNEAMHR